MIDGRNEPGTFDLNAQAVHDRPDIFRQTAAGAISAARAKRGYAFRYSEDCRARKLPDDHPPSPPSASATQLCEFCSAICGPELEQLDGDVGLDMCEGTIGNRS